MCEWDVNNGYCKPTKTEYLKSKKPDSITLSSFAPISKDVHQGFSHRLPYLAGEKKRAYELHLTSPAVTSAAPWINSATFCLTLKEADRHDDIVPYIYAIIGDKSWDLVHERHKALLGSPCNFTHRTLLDLVPT